MQKYSDPLLRLKTATIIYKKYCITSKSNILKEQLHFLKVPKVQVVIKQNVIYCMLSVFVSRILIVYLVNVGPIVAS